VRWLLEHNRDILERGALALLERETLAEKESRALTQGLRMPELAADASE